MWVRMRIGKSLDIALEIVDAVVAYIHACACESRWARKCIDAAHPLLVSRGGCLHIISGHGGGRNGSSCRIIIFLRRLLKHGVPCAWFLWASRMRFLALWCVMLHSAESREEQ